MFGFGSKKILNRFMDAIDSMNSFVDKYNLPFYAYLDGTSKKDYRIGIALEPPTPNVHLKPEYKKMMIECTSLDDDTTNKVNFISGKTDRFFIVLNEYKDNEDYINRAIKDFSNMCKVLNELI